MTKSSVDRKRSKYGEKYSLRFHKKLKTYDLTCNDETPHLIAKFVETDGDLAMRLFERLESNYKENEQLKETNQELYDFRLVLNALLFNEWAETGKYEVYKSKRHHDGEPCFDGEWFIVVAILPSGQVTNHYHIKYWDYFKIPSYERVKDEFDGHTSSVVLLRYGVLLE